MRQGNLNILYLIHNDILHFSGIDLEKFAERFKQSPFAFYPEALKWMIDQGFIADDGKHLYCLPKGLAVLDELLLKLA